MSVFTDLDMDLAKQSIKAARQSPGDRVGVLPEAYEALIARLEAAEACIAVAENEISAVQFEAWLKACGK